jgi:hypothetical protein
MWRRPRGQHRAGAVALPEADETVVDVLAGWPDMAMPPVADLRIAAARRAVASFPGGLSPSELRSTWSPAALCQLAIDQHRAARILARAVDRLEASR